MERLLGSKPDTHIAKILGVSVYSVKRRRVRLKIPAFKQKYGSKPAVTTRNGALRLRATGQPGSVTKAQIKQRILEMAHIGKTHDEIATALDISLSSVRHACQQLDTTKQSAQSGELPANLLKLITDAGFKCKAEVERVYDLDPRYLITLPRFGRKTVNHIAKWLGKPAPTALTVCSLRLAVVRMLDGRYRDITFPSEPLMCRFGEQSWHLLDVESGALMEAILDETGYRLVGKAKRA